MMSTSDKVRERSSDAWFKFKAKGASEPTLNEEMIQMKHEMKELKVQLKKTVIYVK